MRAERVRCRPGTATVARKFRCKRLEKVESAPGFGWLDYAASQSGGARGVRLPSPSPSGAGPPKVRAILDGVMAF